MNDKFNVVYFYNPLQSKINEFCYQTNIQHHCIDQKMKIERNLEKQDLKNLLIRTKLKLLKLKHRAFTFIIKFIILL